MSDDDGVDGDPEHDDDAGFAVREIDWSEVYAPKGRKGMLRRLPRLTLASLKLMWGANRKLFAALAVIQVVTGVVGAAQLLVGKALLDDLLEAVRIDAGLSPLVPALVALFALQLLGSASGSLDEELGRAMTEHASKYVTDRMLNVATAVDLLAYETPELYDKMQRAQIGGMNRPWQITTALFQLLNAVVGALGATAVLLAMEPMLVPIVFIAYAPVWVALVRNGFDSYSFSWDMTPEDRERHYVMWMLMDRHHAKEVRAFNLAPFLRRRHERLYDDRLSRLRDLIGRRLRRSVTASTGTAVLRTAGYGLLVVLVLSERIAVTSAAVAAIAIQQLSGRLVGMFYNAGMLYESALFLEDFTSFLELEPKVAAAQPDAPAPLGFERLAVEDLTFVYPGARRPALRGVSLEIRAGEIVALVGENGSGKTTLAKLLCGLYPPTGGRIMWDGTDLAACRPDEVRDRVAVIFQDFIRYELAARDNIAMGRPEHFEDFAGIAAAAERSGADAFLSTLPDGYDTRLGRMFAGGRDLSIGQWQRVALARAFFRDAPFIVLDEPTAALDPRAEHELFEGIRSLARGRTVLLISHRFSSVRSADRIYVLEKGAVKESGTHQELLESDGVYAELFTLQASAYFGDGAEAGEAGEADAADPADPADQPAPAP